MTELISWKDIGCKLSKNTKAAVAALNFEKPTPIQVHVIPTFMKKKDIVAQAVTGSGKTLAFIIPIIELLNNMESVKPKQVFSIILSPTTELANQIFEMFNTFLSKYNGVKPNLRLFNKKFVAIDNENNRGLIFIATPGAFAKAIEQTVENAALIKSLKTTEVLILDEADRLLEMGFEDQLMTIIKSLPKQRLTGLFSATQTTAVEDLVRAGLRNPVRVSVKVKQSEESEINDTMPKNMDNYYMFINKENKLDVLIKFLSDKKDKKILIFLAACSCVDYYKNVLSIILKKQTVLAFHKKLKSKRAKIFEQFKNMKTGIMLCTDVMARGIDIPDIDWVIQFDPPKSATNFVHRCGRTARCDQYGQTLMFLRSTEDTYLHFLQKNQNVEIQEYKPDFNPDKVDSYEKKMQDLCIADRLLYEKSISAFIAYVMFYRKHELKYIFKLADLNMGKLANSFGLLRIPQMAELKDVNLTDFNDRKVNLTELIYKDKSVRIVKEKTRLIKKARRETEAEAMEVDGEENTGNKVQKKMKKNKKAKNTKVQAITTPIATKTVLEESKPKKRSAPSDSEKSVPQKKTKLSVKPEVKTNKPVVVKPEVKKTSSAYVPATKKKIEIEGKGIMASFNKSKKL